MKVNDDYYGDIGILKGQTLASITGAAPKSERVVFETMDGRQYAMFHEQDCCEGVCLVDVIGDPTDLLGSPILTAEKRTNSEIDPPKCPDSWTWTFYELATIKGTVTLRWLGESNGYYSEDVSFRDMSN